MRLAENMGRMARMWRFTQVFGPMFLGISLSLSAEDTGMDCNNITLRLAGISEEGLKILNTKPDSPNVHIRYPADGQEHVIASLVPKKLKTVEAKPKEKAQKVEPLDRAETRALDLLLADIAKLEDKEPVKVLSPSDPDSADIIARFKATTSSDSNEAGKITREEKTQRPEKLTFAQSGRDIVFRRQFAPGNIAGGFEKHEELYYKLEFSQAGDMITAKLIVTSRQNPPVTFEIYQFSAQALESGDPFTIASKDISFETNSAGESVLRKIHSPTSFWIDLKYSPLPILKNAAQYWLKRKAA